jgi:hypothetical protein
MGSVSRKASGTSFDLMTMSARGLQRTDSILESTAFAPLIVPS